MSGQDKGTFFFDFPCLDELLTDKSLGYPEYKTKVKDELVKKHGWSETQVLGVPCKQLKSIALHRSHTWKMLSIEP